MGLGRIKNIEKLMKEDLALTLLKSESSDAERNYMKHFNNNTDDEDTYDDTFDDKIRDKISDTRMILSRLGNIVDRNDRKKIKKELYEIEKKKNPSNEKKEDKDKKLSVKQYLYKIIPYLIDLINDHKTNRNNSNEWKIQINMHVNFVSSNDTGEIRTIFVWSDNEEIRLGNETDDIIKGLLNSFLNNYQKEEIVLRNGSDFVFESVDLLSYHIHNTSLKRGKSYIKSPEWLINKRATINPKNKDDKCFQYSITVALNHQKIKNHPERISNTEPFIDQYNWEGIKFPTGIKDWKKYERNNKTIALNILLIPHNENTINLAYKSKYNREHENQVVLLMITNGEKWHYIALKSERTDDGFNCPISSLSRLFRGITSNHNGDFYCLNCLHSFRTDNVLKRHERLCDNNDYCSVEMPTQANNTLKYNYGEKS